MNWTQQQEAAIQGRCKKLLVSAAAGSGKTAVLVERVFRRISDAKDPHDVTDFLIVTFTTAAAAETWPSASTVTLYRPLAWGVCAGCV